ncbi:MarR family transcriptional regulator [Nocardia alni]|uniref:MarR family transcriptional regulator n=1 Tax=Nocardia alni TaxID=2815723 RepID=UPI001C24D503|nr:MarR family transcriptional regulator [Nocardia alni]
MVAVPHADDRSLVATLVSAARGAIAAVERELGAEGLTIDHWLVVEMLAAGTAMALTEVRVRTLVSAPTLTRVVDHLVSKALLFREVDAKDRRKVRVRLSKRGMALHRRLASSIAAAEREWAGAHGLSLPDAQPH